LFELSGKTLIRMNLKWIVLLGALAVLGILLACLPSARGINADHATPFIALSGVPVPEIPAKAADLVYAAAPSRREQTAQEVLRAVSVVARPGVLPYVVSAICRRDPEAAGAAVATAIELRPEEVLVFTTAALWAAPSQVQQIVSSACAAAPVSSANVALVAFRQLPSAKDLILAGFADALPDLQLYMEKAELQVGTNDGEAIIKQTVQLWTDAFKAPVK